MTSTSVDLERRKKQCWVCGAEKGLTSAHVLPKFLKPHHNKRIPLCVPCHRRVDLRFQFQRQLRDTIFTLRELLREYGAMDKEWKREHQAPSLVEGEAEINIPMVKK